METPKVSTSKRVAASAALGLVLLPLGGGGVSVAHAEPVSLVGQDQYSPNDPNPDIEFWSRFHLSDGTVAFCAGDPQHHMEESDGAVMDNSNYTTVSGEFTALGNSHWTAEAGHAAGYILSKYGASTEISPAAIQYAVMSLASPYYPGGPVGLTQDIIDQAEALKAEALQEAPKYVDFKLGTPEIALNAENSGGTVTTNITPGNYTVKIVLSGGATFADGSSEMSVNAAEAPATLDFVIPEGTPAGEVKVDVSSTDVPATSFKILEDPTYQDLFIAGSPAQVEATAAAVPFTPTAPPAPEPTPEPTPPSVSTVASDDVQLVDGKAELFDNLKVEGDVPEGAYATVALYKLSDSTDEAAVLAGDLKCETPVATTGKIAIDKAGDYQTEKIAVTEAGTYGFVETLYDKDGNVLDQGACGEVSETVVVTPAPTPEPKPTPPTVSTVASDDVQLDENGEAELFDNLKVEGDVPAGAYATVALYKLSDSTDEKAVLAGELKCETPVATTGKIDISGAGDYQTEKVKVTEAGTYGFVETLYDKDGNVLDQGECGEVTETVVVTPAPAPEPEPTAPSVSTVASDDVQLKDGKAELFDNLKVEGDVPEGAYATVALYKLSDSTDEKAVLVGDLKCETPVATTDKIQIPAAGNYQTEKITVTEAGTYGFVETLYDKDGNVLDKGECGEVTETVVVTPTPEAPKPTPTTPETPVPEVIVTPAPKQSQAQVQSQAQTQQQTQKQAQTQTQQQNQEAKTVRSVVANTAAGAVQEAKDANLLAIAGGVGMAVAAVATVLTRRKK